MFAFFGAFVAAPLAASAQPTRGTGTDTLAGTTADGDTTTGTVTDLVASVNDAGAVVRGVFTADATGTANNFGAELIGAAAEAGC